MGYIYCASNSSFPGLLKIGMTMRAPEERVKELFTTGVPTPFKIEFTRYVNNPEEHENNIHTALKNYRVPSREFFNVSVDQVISVFDKYLPENIPVFLSVEDVLRSEDVSEEDKKRMITCLHKVRFYAKHFDYMPELNREDKEEKYNEWAKETGGDLEKFNEYLKQCILNEVKRYTDGLQYIENTSITWHDDRTFIYRVDSDGVIEYVKTFKSSNYWQIASGFV